MRDAKDKGPLLKSALRSIPSVDSLISTPEVKELLDIFPHWLVVTIARAVLEELRSLIIKRIEMEGVSYPSRDDLLNMAVNMVAERLDLIRTGSLKRVINGTGIIIHTNLGRAPLAPEAISLINEVARGYSNLEYILTEGRRGDRTDHIREHLLRLTGATDAFVVNNNAGALLLALNSMAEGKEVIVSRGELVEIGGSFRIPDVVRKSGALMREVGTTNRTHLQDYEDFINDNTALLLKVHTSNYRIVGFSSEASLCELVELGKRHGIPVMMDLGSGNFIDLTIFGLKGEEHIRDILSTGVDIVTFSGDKLLGGPQAGIILTQDEVAMAQVRANPLARALRIDKMTLAGLEATLMLYQQNDYTSSIPVLRMISTKIDELESRANNCLQELKGVNKGMMGLKILKGTTSAGGGALPAESIPTFLIAFCEGKISEQELEEAFRTSSPPVIGRIQDEMYILDVRTIQENEIPVLVKLYKDIVDKGIAHKQGIN